MNFPKPLLPSQDRYEPEQIKMVSPTWFAVLDPNSLEYKIKEQEYLFSVFQMLNPRPKPEPRMSRFATVFCWVLVLTGFALMGWAFAEYV